MDQSVLILQRLDHIESRIDQLEVKIDEHAREMKNAFPGGDYDGHRRFHEAWIRQIETRRKLSEAIKEKTIVNLVWIGLLGIGAAVAAAVVNYIRKGG